MGQYFKAININDREWIYTHDYGDGLKLMEHSYLQNSFVGAVMILLSPKGKWYGKRIVWAGDYGEKYASDFLTDPIEIFANNIDKPEGNLYAESEQYTKVKPKSMSKAKQIKAFIINIDKKQYFSCADLKPYEDGWTINPLPLLTSDGNGNDGGDYNGTCMDLVGSWAGDHIGLEWSAPEGYENIEPDFNEGRE